MFKPMDFEYPFLFIKLSIISLEESFASVSLQINHTEVPELVLNNVSKPFVNINSLLRRC